MMKANKQEYSVIKKAIKNDKNAFVQLCEIIVSRVLYMCKSNMSSWQEAEDAAQEVFIVLQRNITKIESPEVFYAWLNKTVILTCKNIRRKEMKQDYNIPIEDVNESLLADTLDDLPVDYVENRELQERIVNLIDSLPYMHRQCVLLHYFQKLSYTQVADVLECKESDVRNNLHRARQILRVELEEERKNNAPLWSVSAVVAIGPALEAILEQSAASAVPAGAAESVLKNAGVYAGAAGLTASGAAHGFAIWRISSAALKFIAITAAIAAGGAAIAYTAQGIANQPPSTPPAISATAMLPPEHSEEETPDLSDEDMPVQPAEYQLSGRVTLDNSNTLDRDANNGLAGITFELINAEDGSLISSAKTLDGAEAGIFTFEGMGAGSCKIKACLPKGAVIINPADCEDAGNGSVWLLHSGSPVFLLEEAGIKKDFNIVLSFNSEISGNIVLEAGGKELDGSYVSFPETTVKLLDPDKRVIARTTTDEKGCYTFKNPMISQSGSYSLQYLMNASQGFSVPESGKYIELEPGKNTAVPNYVLKDNTAPHLTVLVEDGDFGSKHINPKRVEIQASDATKVTFVWQISDYATGELVAAGASNSALGEAIAALADGGYTLSVTATDQGGNSSEASHLVSIMR